MKRALALATILTLSACVERKAPPPAPPPRPVPVIQAAPPPPLASNWEDWPRSPGDWSYRRDARGSVAMFGPAGMNASFVARCDTVGRRIFLSRPGNFADGVTGVMTIRTSTALKTYPASNSNETPPYIAAELAPGDAHLDAMAFSRGKFLIVVKGATDLVIPPWPELARVIEDCR